MSTDEGREVAGRGGGEPDRTQLKERSGQQHQRRTVGVGTGAGEERRRRGREGETERRTDGGEVKLKVE
jgi:hypothetical protein